MRQKDPAFLFYTEAFLTGTMFMTDREVGIYTRLLCIQHQCGGLIDKETFLDRTKDVRRVASKFIESEHGFFNERLASEMEKRAKKSKSMSTNALSRWSTVKQDMQLHSNGIAIAMQLKDKDTNALSLDTTTRVSPPVVNLIPDAGPPIDVQRAGMSEHLKRVDGAYPKKASWQSVVYEWATAVRGMTPEQEKEFADKCLFAISWQKKQESWKDPGFIPQFKDWLDRRQYDNQCPRELDPRVKKVYQP